MINIDFIYYIIEYAKTESLTKASKALHISQSALTRAMQKVEDYITVPIFTRTKNKLSLTETGQEFIKNAKIAVEEFEKMREKTINFHNSFTNISIGIMAPGPMLKYGNTLFSAFPNKSIVSKVDTFENLKNSLLDGLYDFIFTTTPLDMDDVTSSFVFKESLYISVPKSHFISGMANGVHFSEIDGQSFLVADNLGIWENVITKFMPKSKFFKQSFDNLYEIINSSTIPSFATNVTLPNRLEVDRINIPILDEEAKMDFYLSYKTQNKTKIENFLRMI